ncbi:hypothetical protein Vadar_014463 [Vaccinium darrowii]|uniref:Uncharacterized protein n=1 Tax=Vaccinium darrowii TaxID=229202 RepID=A0ACB7YV69_9ERIC|nr:hypothetical protein Vadar_014463 [Vaccinium darrowii]
MVSKCRGLPLAIVVLEMLPKLTILVMFGCGLTELVCSCAGGFPQLQILRIVVCDVNKFQVEEGGMPVLKEGKQDVDYQMRKWISDMRDVLYEAEDIIDNFILKVETEGEAKTQKKIGLKDCFEKYFCIRSKNASLIQ